MRAARANGHRVYLFTGRSRAEIYPNLWQLGVDGVIGSNKSYVEDGAEVVFHQVMDAAVVAEAIQWLTAEDLGYYLECNSGLFGSANLPGRAAAAIGRPHAADGQFIRDAFPDMIYGDEAIPPDSTRSASRCVPTWTSTSWRPASRDAPASTPGAPRARAPSSARSANSASTRAPPSSCSPGIRAFRGPN